MSDQQPNVLTPRQLAVAYLAERQQEVRRAIVEHRAEHPDPQPYFQSQIRVFLEQVAWELGRAAHYLETTDASQEDPDG